VTEEIELFDLDGCRQSWIWEENKETEVTVCGLFGVGAGTTVGQSLACCIQKP